MRQVFLDKDAIVLNNVSQPILEDSTVLVSVHYSCISTETETATIANAQESLFFSNIPEKVSKVFESVATSGIESTKALIKEKLAGSMQALGYSCSGKVIAVGKKIQKFRPGDYVACAGAGLAGCKSYNNRCHSFTRITTRTSATRRNSMCSWAWSTWSNYHTTCKV